MIIGYFTERPYRWVPEDEVLRNEGFTKGEMPCGGIYPRPSEQAPENDFRQNHRSNDYLLMIISSGEGAE